MFITAVDACRKRAVFANINIRLKANSSEL